MHLCGRALLRIGDVLATIVVAVCVSYAVGKLFIWLWAPAPTPENSSPPPEAFLFLWGAFIGFVAVVLGGVFWCRSGCATDTSSCDKDGSALREQFATLAHARRA